jgi:hypothetical protein
MISKSPKRHTFQVESYLKKCAEQGVEPNQDYLKLFEESKNLHSERFDDISTTENNLEYDLLTTDWILEKVRNNETYAQNLYAAMCNTDFVKNELWPVIQDKRWSCSWRYAGGIIADMRQEGDYIDWYCSGIGSDTMGYVGEGYVTEEVRKDFLKLGWIVFEDQ